MKHLLIPYNREKISADAVAGGLDNGQSDGASDGGIDGVASALQHAQPGLRGERLACSDDIFRQNRRSLRAIGKIEFEGMHLSGHHTHPCENY